jgi:hypothetical protein
VFVRENATAVENAIARGMRPARKVDVLRDHIKRADNANRTLQQ